MPIQIARCALLAIVSAASAQAFELGAPVRVADLRPNAYAAYTTRSVVPDGKGGVVAFGRMAKAGDNARVDVVATPIDAAGTPHPESAVTIVVGAAAESIVAAAKTPNGYLVGFRDVQKNGYVVPLNAELKLTANPLVITGEEPWPIACDGDVCAAGTAKSLLLLDPFARSAGSVARSIRALTAIPGKGFAAAAASSGPFGIPLLEVAFISRSGAITASALMSASSGAVAIAPHPVGVALFRATGTQIEAMLVRADGTLGQKVEFPAPGFSVRELAVAAGGGQFGVVFASAMTAPPCTCAPTYAIWSVRLAESFVPPDPAVRISVPAGDSNEPRIAGAAGGFIAVWNHNPSYYGVTGARSLLVPAAGRIDATASLALRSAAASQVAAVIATTGERTLALWSSLDSESSPAAYATLLDRYGRRLRTAAMPPNLHDFAVATDGRDFMIAALETVGNGSAAELRLVAVDGGDGSVRLLPFRSGYAPVQIAWDGAAYMLTTYDNDRLGLTRVAPDGGVLWSRVLSGAGRIAAAGGRTIVAGSKSGAIVYDVLDSEGRVIASKTIGASNVATVDRVVASRRGEFLLLVVDGAKVFATRVAADGTAIDAAPVELPLTTVPAAAVAVGQTWFITAGSRIVDFPSLRHTELDGERIVGGSAGVDGRGQLLTARSETIDGTTVEIATLRDLLDGGVAPPRRRGATH